jgi:hypothetical protein
VRVSWCGQRVNTRRADQRQSFRSCSHASGHRSVRGAQLESRLGHSRWRGRRLSLRPQALRDELDKPRMLLEALDRSGCCRGRAAAARAGARGRLDLRLARAGWEKSSYSHASTAAAARSAGSRTPVLGTPVRDARVHRASAAERSARAPHGVADAHHTVRHCSAAERDLLAHRAVPLQPWAMTTSPSAVAMRAPRMPLGPPTNRNGSW